MTAQHFTKSDIIEAVGRRYYNRGLDYVPERVHLRDVALNRARAVVIGTRAYVAEFEFSNGRITGKCTCPASMNKNACKHVAATALAYMADDLPRADTDIVHSFVAGLSHRELVETIMAQTVDNQAFFESLLRGAVLNGAPLTASPNSLRSAVNDALEDAMSGGEDPDLPLEDAIRMLRAGIAAAMYPAVAEVALMAATKLDDCGQLHRYGDDHEMRSWDDEDVEPEPSIDEAAEFLAIHAEAEKLCGASPGYVAHKVAEIIRMSEFARERTEMYVRHFGEEFRERVRALPDTPSHDERY
ncbi:hypothetical protein G6L37_35060 [Agrobacterium rubi]|nr:hypothetical protein [Agrobacterium rubi]NTF23790.1 hypothetical protein [Agrobacterium rubi]